MHKQLMTRVQEKHKGDPRSQIAAFLQEAILLAAIGRRRPLSEKTLSDYGNVLQQCITDLAQMRVHIENISDLGQRQVIRLVKFWGEKKHAEGTIQGRVSIIRRFLNCIGAASQIPTGRAWKHLLLQSKIEAGTLVRSNIATLPKGWVDMGYDARTIIEGVSQENAIAGCLLDCMWAFGLRVNEAVQLQPSVSDKGSYITVYRGTKGGKLREVPFSKDPAKRAWQHSVLETAKLLASAHPKGVLAEKGLKLAQMKNSLRHVLKKHGVCKKGLGITPHGLRHQFGTDLFKELTGLPAPVLESVPAEVYSANADSVEAALLEISRQMGHERPSISGAYVSSVPKMARVETSRLAGWLAGLGSCGPAFNEADVAEAWIIGKAAFGLPAKGGGALQLAARPRTFDAATLEKFERLTVSLENKLGMRISVTAWTAADRPDDGAEILFVAAR